MEKIIYLDDSRAAKREQSRLSEAWRVAVEAANGVVAAKAARDKAEDAREGREALDKVRAAVVDAMDAMDAAGEEIVDAQEAMDKGRDDRGMLRFREALKARKVRDGDPF